MKKYFAELIGTMLLVLIGCGTVVFSGTTVGQLGIAMAFGLALITIIYVFGSVSGAHVNPAVSLGMLAGGKLNCRDFTGYVISQFLGALIAACILKSILMGKIGGYNGANLAQNGWGVGYGQGYGFWAAAAFEFIATFIFVRICMEGDRIGNSRAPLVIGLSLLVFHLVGLQISGASLNPARSFGPAMLVGGRALNQLWLFFVAPLAGGLLAGLAHRYCPCCNRNGGCCSIHCTNPEK